MDPNDLSQFTDYCHLEEGVNFTSRYFPKETFLPDREPTAHTADTERGKVVSALERGGKKKKGCVV